MKNILSKYRCVAILILMSFLILSNSQLSAQEIIAMTDEVPHKVDVLTMDVSSDGKYLVTGDIEGIIVYRHLETGKLVYTHQMGEYIHKVKFVDNNHTVYVIYENVQDVKGNISVAKYDFIKDEEEYIYDFEENISGDLTFDISSDNTKLAISYTAELMPNFRKVDIIDLKSQKVNQFTFYTNLAAVSFEYGGNWSVMYEPVDAPGSFMKEIYDKNNRLISKNNIPKINIYLDIDNKIISKTNDTFNFVDLARNISKKISIPESEESVNQFEFSQDGRYLATASGRESNFWSVGYGMNEDGYGSVILYDIVNNHIIYKTSGKERQFQHNVTDLKWIDSGNYIATNYKGNLHIYNVYESDYVKAFIKPDEIRKTSIDVNNTLSEIYYSVEKSHTAKFKLFEDDPVKMQDTLYYEKVGLAEDGTVAAAGCEFQRTCSILWEGQQYFKNHPFLTEFYDQAISDDGNYVVTSSAIQGNYYYPPHKAVIEEYLYSMMGEPVGIVIEGIEMYFENMEPYLGKSPTDSVEINIFDFLYVTDLDYEGESYFIKPANYTSKTFISSDGNYLSIKSILYQMDAENEDVWSIFNLRNREWKKVYNVSDQVIRFNHFDPNSSLAYTVFNDKRTIIWDTNTEQIYYDFPTNTSYPEIVSFNKKYNQLVIVLVGEISILDMNTAAWDIKQPAEVEDVLVAEFSPSGNFLKLEGEVETPEGIFYNMYFYKYPSMELIYQERSRSTDFYTNQYNKNIYFHKTRDICMLYNGEGSILLINLEKEELMATIKLLPNGEWLAYTPNGLFDASKKGREILYYVVGQEVVLYDQIKEKYWEPGLLDKILNKPGLIDSEISKEIALFPDPTLTLSDSDGMLKVNLKKREGGIGRVSLFINNKEVSLDINPNRKTDFEINLMDYAKYLYEVDVNEISIAAYNKENWLRSRKETIFLETNIAGGRDVADTQTPPFTSTSRTSRTQSNTNIGLYGLFVGTSKYKNKSLDLKFADKDATKMVDAFQKISEGMYDKDRVKLKVLTSDAENLEDRSSKDNILKQFQIIAEEAKPDDIIMLFFSGHGITIDDDFYYLTSDAGNIDIQQDVEGRNQVTLSAKEINEALRKIVANKQIMVLDACHSGQITKIFQGGGKAISTSQQKALEFLEDKMGLYILASSESNQKSFETTRLEQGLLTFSLLLGMSGEAVDDGVINVVDLLSYASKESEQIGKRILGTSQRPVLGIGNAGNSFPIGFENDSLKVRLPQEKILITRPNFSVPPVNNDPEILEVTLMKQLEERGAFGTSEKFTYTANYEEANAYKITGTYQIEDTKINITWYLTKGEEVSGPFNLKVRKKDIVKVADKLIDDAIEQISPREE